MYVSFAHQCILLANFASSAARLNVNINLMEIYLRLYSFQIVPEGIFRKRPQHFVFLLQSRYVLRVRSNIRR